MSKKSNKNIRNVAIVGPYSSGKTTLLESILFVTKAITRKGSIKDRNTVSDNSAEAPRSLDECGSFRCEYGLSRY